MTAILRAAQAFSLLGLGILTWLSLTPIQTMPINDKLAHLMAYTLLSFVTASGFGKSVGYGPIAVALMTYGVILEALQDLSPYRMFEVNDMIANVIGIIIGVSATKLVLTRWAASRTEELRD